MRDEKRRKWHVDDKARILERRLQRNHFKRVAAPEVFSIANNAEGSLSFFHTLQFYVSKGYPVMLDLQGVQSITVDTLLYLLAVWDKLDAQNIKYHISGNLPSHSSAASRFKKSGFLRFVDSRSELSGGDKAEVVQIYAGEKVEPTIAGDICKFIQHVHGKNKGDTSKIYEMLVEIMTNTKHHAYGKRDKKPKWYVYAEYIPSKRDILISILDTGKGIPATLKRRIGEKLFGISDAKIIASALRGDFRTSTGLTFRGRGLPMIKKSYDDGVISDLVIVSRKGYLRFDMDEKLELTNELVGTLYIWRVKP